MLMTAGAEPLPRAAGRHRRWRGGGQGAGGGQLNSSSILSLHPRNQMQQWSSRNQLQRDGEVLMNVGRVPSASVRVSAVLGSIQIDMDAQSGPLTWGQRACPAGKRLRLALGLLQADLVRWLGVVARL